MKTLLWLDDIRDPFLNREGKVPKGNYVIFWVLDYNAFVEWVERFGLPDIISFDHDLADIHYTATGNIDILKSEWQEKTGMDCAKWLVDYCIDNKLDLPEYFVHSANPVGKENIEKYLGNYIKSQGI